MTAPWYERRPWRWLWLPTRVAVGLGLLVGGLVLWIVETPVLWLYVLATNRRTAGVAVEVVVAGLSLWR